MSELAAFLDSIEADPGDDSLWLVFADWLEERGDPLSADVRTAVAAGTRGQRAVWEKLSQGLLKAITHREAQLVACDCLERLLPLFESKYPDDRSPREFIEVFRQFSSGKKVTAARRALEASQMVVQADFDRNSSEFGGISYFLGNMRGMKTRPDHTCVVCASLAAQSRFGHDFQPPASLFTPRFRSLQELEYRWQVARTLRYRPVGPSPA